jgi:hypothetical protein
MCNLADPECYFIRNGAFRNGRICFFEIILYAISKHDLAGSEVRVEGQSMIAGGNLFRVIQYGHPSNWANTFVALGTSTQMVAQPPPGKTKICSERYKD